MYSRYASSRGGSFETATRLAVTLGLSETQVVHVALSNLARQTLPRYEADNGPLTRQQMNEIRRVQPPGRMKVKKRTMYGHSIKLIV